MKRPIQNGLATACLIGFFGNPISALGPNISVSLTSNFTAFEEQHAAIAPTGHSRDTCVLQVQPAHYSLSCQEVQSTTNIPKPTVVSECGAVVSLTFSDEYFELGCGVHGFTGYFHPSRWTSGKIHGDDGVDVTGAPDSKLLVEGTNNTPVEVARGQEGNFTIVVPASGYVYFGWTLNGSSIITSSEVSPRLLVNGNPTFATLQEDQWVSPYLRSGDEFTFLLPGQAGVYTIQDFSFYTNARGVIAREWSASDDRGNEGYFVQLLTLDRPSFSDVQLPAATHITISRADQWPEQVGPEYTGFPYLRNQSLPTEIHELCAMDIAWQDELLTTDFGLILVRHWTLTDQCNQNSVHGNQYINISDSRGIPPLTPPQWPGSRERKRANSDL